jgi:acyl carrier protein
MSDVQGVIFDTIASDARIPRENISLDSTLADLGIDSLEAIEIVFNLEERFKISFPDRDPSFDTGTVRGLVDAVERLLAGQAAGPGETTPAVEAAAPEAGVSGEAKDKSQAD